ncbi:MAG: ASCH domain-containing protein [SAR324 cluster bacterium]|nr:ASCH domain-containing protein [SAR324 cluster bacterium]
MQTHVLLSIKPQFANLILSGEKKFEFRRAIFKSKSVQKVIVYASSPVQRVIGEFELDGILSDEKENLWKTTQEYSGIQKEFYDSYFAGKDVAHALKVKNVIRYEEPLMLQSFSVERAPQSFQYLDI